MVNYSYQLMEQLQILQTKIWDALNKIDLLTYFCNIIIEAQDPDHLF